MAIQFIDIVNPGVYIYNNILTELKQCTHSSGLKYYITPSSVNLFFIYLFHVTTNAQANVGTKEA